MRRRLDGLLPLLAAFLLLAACGVQSLRAQGSGLPALVSVPDDLDDSVRIPLINRRASIAVELANFQAAGEAFNRKDADAQTDTEFQRLQAERDNYIRNALAFNARVAAAIRAQAGRSENFFSTVPGRALIPMTGARRPADGATPAPNDGRGLVGGATWTFGYKWPRAACDGKCEADITTALARQLALYCASQADSDKCIRDGLPFGRENYDFVLSMGSSHNAIEDLATRVIWDGAEFGEFSRRNKEIFAGLTGRNFDMLDCHSNGAMLCLAALRSGGTTAKEVRLFGPQINPAAAALWREYAAKTGAKITVYINNGDPITAASWMQPTPQTVVSRAATAAWLTSPILGPAALAGALFHTWLDSKKAVMDDALGNFGLEVTRFYPGPQDVTGCKGAPALSCHSMLLYESNLDDSRAKQK